MTGSRHDDIRWFRSKLVAAQFGTLEDAEEDRFNRLRDSNPACMRLHEEFASRGPEPEPGDHLPAEMIARWGRLESTLRGKEREVVMAHLAHCDDCQEELELLGFSLASGRASAERAEARVIRIVRESAGLWKQRIFAGWALVATAAAMVLALRMGTFAPPQVAQRVDTGVPPVAETPSDVAVSPPSERGALGLSASIRLSAVARGAEADTSVWRLDPADMSLAIDISNLVTKVTASHPIDLVLTDPAGVQTRQSSTHDSLAGQRLIVTNGGLPPITGVYRLNITERDPDGPIVHPTVYFRIVADPRR
jgi:hypothetical protein